MRLYAATNPNALDKTQVVAIAPDPITCAQRASYLIATSSLGFGKVRNYKQTGLKLTREFKTNAYTPPRNMQAAVSLVEFEQLIGTEWKKQIRYPNPYITEIDASIVTTVLLASLDDGTVYAKSKVFTSVPPLLDQECCNLAHAVAIDWCRSMGKLNTSITLQRTNITAISYTYNVQFITEEGDSYRRTITVLFTADIIGA